MMVRTTKQIYDEYCKRVIKKCPGSLTLPKEKWVGLVDLKKRIMLLKEHREEQQNIWYQKEFEGEIFAYTNVLNLLESDEE